MWQISLQKQKRRPFARPPPVSSDGVIELFLALKRPKGKGLVKSSKILESLPHPGVGSACMTVNPKPLLIPRRTLAGAVLPLLGLASRPAQAARVFRFDQSRGRLEFTARHLLMLTSTGQFSRFICELALDPERPETARVAVEVETASITHAYPGAADLLRSSAYFDAGRWPLARFEGRGLPGGRMEAFDLAGTLEMRGVTQPCTLQAKLARRRRDPATGAEIADCTARGEVSRAAFGMMADMMATGDRVQLAVSVSLVIGEASAG
jgi:polyisoprenoid-binding protein YceI